jgi:hypothetical protein
MKDSFVGRDGRKDGKRRGCINYYLFNYLVNKGKKFENQVLIIKMNIG